MYHHSRGKKQTYVEVPEVQQSNRSIRRAELRTHMSKQKVAHVEEPDYGMHRWRKTPGPSKNLSLIFDGGGRRVVVCQL
jgi:hypothetical protein